MHASNDTCGNHFPIFDEGPQPLGMECKARSVERRYRIAAGEEGQKALCAGIHPQDVPISVEHEYGIRLKLCYEKLDRLACSLQFRRGESGITIEWRIAGREQQRIALAQRNLQSLSKTQDHLSAWLCAARLDATEMTS